MKKSLTLLLLVLFTISFTLAQDTTSETPDIDEGLKEIGDVLKDETKPFKSSFENEVELPKFLKFPARLIFGVPTDKNLSVEDLIVLVLIGCFFILFIKNSLEITPFFKSKVLSFIGAILITALIQMTGVIKMLLDYLFEFIEFLLWFETFGWIKVLLGILLAIALFYGSKKITILLQRKLSLEKGEVDGTSLNTAVKISKIQAKNLE